MENAQHIARNTDTQSMSNPILERLQHSILSTQASITETIDAKIEDLKENPPIPSGVEHAIEIASQDKQMVQAALRGQWGDAGDHYVKGAKESFELVSDGLKTIGKVASYVTMPATGLVLRSTPSPVKLW